MTLETTIIEGRQALSGAELESLMLIIDASLKVTQRHHFFSWAQGLLQGLLPHDLMVCTMCDFGARSCQMESFSCFPLPPDWDERICSGQNGLVRRLIEAWETGERKPVLIEGSAQNGLAPIAQDLVRHKLRNVAAHGTCGAGGEASSFFSLLGVPGRLGERHAYFLELLVPHMHAAWLRTRLGVAPEKRAVPGDRVLTRRELEVLHWIHEGKSNHEIGAMLAISPYTVKNHVQKILRKLKVQNRTQAAARSYG